MMYYRFDAEGSIHFSLQRFPHSNVNIVFISGRTFVGVFFYSRRQKWLLKFIIKDVLKPCLKFEALLLEIS